MTYQYFKRIGFFLVAINFLISISLPIQQVKGSTESNWTLMFYFDGDNKLSDVMEIFLELIQNIESSSNVQLAVIIDGKFEDDTKLYYIVDNNLNEQNWPSESDMDDIDTLQQFIQKVMSECESIYYALFTETNKGSAWQGICYDEHGDGTMITMPELLDALYEVTENGVKKLDIFHTYTCMGGNLELAYQIKSYCKYFIGSPECGLVDPSQGIGTPYIASISDLISDPSMTPEEFSKCIINHFKPVSYTPLKIKTTLLAVDLSYMDQLASGLHELADFFIDHLDEYKDDIITALSNTRIFGEMWDINYLIEPYHFIDLLTIDDPQFQTIKDKIISTIDIAIIANKHVSNDNINCLNLYLPRDKGDYNLALRYDDGVLPSPYEETQFSINTNWDEFIKIFLGITVNLPPTQPTLTGPTKGKPGEEYEYMMVSTDPNENKITYCIQWGDGSDETWMGAFNSGEEVSATHVWNETGDYTIMVKAKDHLGAESDWQTLEVKMPKTRSLYQIINSIFLIGKIADIETNPEGEFRFLPINLLHIGYTNEDGLFVDILSETYGGFPCCGYIEPDDFYGILTDRIICGIWFP